MKVIDVDLELCVGHGKCYMVAPELFEPIDDDGCAGYCGGPLDPDDATVMDRAEKAIRSCPEDALTLRDAHDHEGR